MTLYELVARQQYTKETDAELIAEWFTTNDMALNGIKIISKLAEDKIKLDEQKYGKLTGQMLMYNNTEVLIKEFGVEDGCHLEDIIRRFIIYKYIDKLQDFESCYQKDIEWLKEFIPKKKLPFLFWQEFLVWLNEKGIYFKNQKKEQANEET